MYGEIRIPVAAMMSFCLVLVRVGGAFVFVPVPGFKNLPRIARVVLIAGMTIALLPVWPRVSPEQLEVGTIVLWLLTELTFGVTVGLSIAFLNEAFVLASQIFGLQAGYGYASTVDPATQADSSVLQILAHLTAGLLFFALGLHREVIRLFAESLRVLPPGGRPPTIAAAEPILALGGQMFAIAVRMALPVVALLMLVDLSLALLGRINSQLQLLMLAFPAKMLVSMILLAAIAVALPRLYQAAAGPTLETLGEVLLRAW